MFAAVDIYPTVCGLAGIPVPAHCAGKDMSEIMRGRNAARKEADMVFRMCDGPAAALNSNDADEDFDDIAPNASKAPAYRGCRTDTHTYAVDTAGRWLLFDNVADPYQMKNLARDPAQNRLMDSLDLRIKAWMASTGDPFPYPSNS